MTRELIMQVAFLGVFLRITLDWLWIPDYTGIFTDCPACCLKFLRASSGFARELHGLPSTLSQFFESYSFSGIFYDRDP